MDLPYYTDPTVTLHTGDVTEILAALPDQSVHCVVTSPPYWGLRDYGTGTWIGGQVDCAHSVRRPTDTGQSGDPCVDNLASPVRRDPTPPVCRRCGATRKDRQYGLETTPEDYVDTLRGVFTQLRRVLVDTGTVWLNLGDCYSSEPPGRSADAMRASTLSGRAVATVMRESIQSAGVRRTGVLPHKNLLGMPWRVAFALQTDGWILRNAIIWHKTNAMPESVRDRLSTRYEILFLFAKQARYFFDLEPIREPFIRREAATMRPAGRQHAAAHSRGKNPGDVWSIPTRPLRAAHLAAFPIDIPLRCVAASCPPDGVVLDPFSGAATTGLAARQLGRRYIGIDLNPEFHNIALHRLGLTPSRVEEPGSPRRTA